jgi:hypothetical protein
MKSYNVQVHCETERLQKRGKKPWVKPSIETIALESAENGIHRHNVDGNGGNASRIRS